MNRPSTSAVAAAVTAITLAVVGVVVAAIDDERPMVVRSASDAAPFVEPPATTEPAPVESTTTTEAADDETSTTTVRRVQPSPATTATTAAPVETKQAGPVEETTTTTSTPPTTSAPSRWAAPWEENYPTTTTTTPPEKKWVTIARFEWTEFEPEIMRIPATLETGTLRVRTTYTQLMNHAMVWFDDPVGSPNHPTMAGCHPVASNPGTIIYFTQPWTENDVPCAPFPGPWPIGDKVIDFGRFDYSVERWRGPTPVTEGTHILWVEELR